MHFNYFSIIEIKWNYITPFPNDKLQMNQPKKAENRMINHSSSKQQVTLHKKVRLFSYEKFPQPFERTYTHALTCRHTRAHSQTLGLSVCTCTKSASSYYFFSVDS